MKRFRLFWLMVIAFAMAILLALCSLLGFIGLTFSGTIPSSDFPTGLSETSDAYADILTDFYIANDRSWVGVERRMQAPQFSGQSSFYSYSLFDQRGDLLVSTDGDAAKSIELSAFDPPAVPNMPRRQNSFERPNIQRDLTVRGERVGVLIVRPGFAANAGQGSNAMNQRPTFLWGIWRGFVFAGFGFGGLLIGLAVIFARRVTRPLHGLTTASEALAAGQLDTRVPRVRIRELDELAGAFNRMAERLSSADAQRRQMTADIAHELRTPLSIIRGRLEGLQDGVYQATPEHVDGLLQETAMLERLVEDLRLLALAEAGQLPLYREATDPHSLLEGVIHGFADQAKQQGVYLRVDAVETLPELDVDPQRIAQVLTNLVSNALRHTPDGGEVILRAQYTPGAARLVLSVQDTGPGIEVEDLPHLFDRFWRADRSRTRGSGGSGLGLAIVKQIVEAHAGSIHVESSIGNGAVFRIELPLYTNRSPNLIAGASIKR